MIKTTETVAPSTTIEMMDVVAELAALRKRVTALMPGDVVPTSIALDLLDATSAMDKSIVALQKAFDKGLAVQR